jgi:triosephosphate isomerase
MKSEKPVAEKVSMSIRKPLIAANWKMYKTPDESAAFIREFLPLVEGHTRDEIAFFPTMSSLSTVLCALKGTDISAGAQTMHWLDEGPYTGQTSPTMLESIACRHVLLGHSERRMYANETDDMVNLKLKAAITHNLTPIVCVGESLDKREAGLTEAVLNWQIACALIGVKAEQCGKLVIAYEPIWAIGTGSIAAPNHIQAAHEMIRRQIAKTLGKDVAEQTRVIYGGSVKPENIEAVMAEADVDGVLVGAASLKPETFAKIVKYRQQATGNREQ